MYFVISPDANAESTGFKINLKKGVFSFVWDLSLLRLSMEQIIKLAAFPKIKAFTPHIGIKK